MSAFVNTLLDAARGVNVDRVTYVAKIQNDVDGLLATLGALLLSMPETNINILVPLLTDIDRLRDTLFQRIKDQPSEDDAKKEKSSIRIGRRSFVNFFCPAIIKTFSHREAQVVFIYEPENIPRAAISEVFSAIAEDVRVIVITEQARIPEVKTMVARVLREIKTG